MANTAEGGLNTWLRRFPEWVEKCNEVHKNKYSYNPDCVMVAGRRKVSILCPKHGEFMQDAAKHKLGQGCPMCAGNVQWDTKQKLEGLFPGYVFPETLPTTKEYFTLTCPVHGDFQTKVNQLLNTRAGQPSACPKCNCITRGFKSRNTDTLSRLKQTHPEYEFDAPDSVKLQDFIRYKCQEHGWQTARASDMLYAGSKCPVCALATRAVSVKEAVGVSVRDNVTAVSTALNHKVILHLSSIASTQDYCIATCLKHGRFRSKLYAMKAGHGCPECVHRISKGESEVFEWLKGLGVENLSRQRKDLLEQGELDIVVDDRVAIEYCGLFWHRSGLKVNNYHYLKAEDAGKAGLKLVTLFEDEWVHRQEAVKSAIISLIGLDKVKVYARDTKVRLAQWHEVCGLYESKHLQGAGSPCSENYVLEHDGCVVAAMSFKPDRFGGADLELVRYVSSVRVVGGFSKLFSAFKENHTPGTSVVSYCDLRWFSGHVYSTVGFKCVSVTSPGYWWCKGNKRYSRFMFQKHKLHRKLENFDPVLSESENMVANGFWKIHDCGMSKWEIVL